MTNRAWLYADLIPEDQPMGGCLRSVLLSGISNLVTVPPSEVGGVPFIREFDHTPTDAERDAVVAAAVADPAEFE